MPASWQSKEEWLRLINCGASAPLLSEEAAGCLEVQEVTPGQLFYPERADTASLDSILDDIGIARRAV